MIHLYEDGFNKKSIFPPAITPPRLNLVSFIALYLFTPRSSDMPGTPPKREPDTLQILFLFTLFRAIEGGDLAY